MVKNNHGLKDKTAHGSAEALGRFRAFLARFTGVIGFPWAARRGSQSSGSKKIETFVRKQTPRQFGHGMVPTSFGRGEFGFSTDFLVRQRRHYSHPSRRIYFVVGVAPPVFQLEPQPRDDGACSDEGEKADYEVEKLF